MYVNSNLSGGVFLLIFDVFLISVALALDAFGVALSLGLDKKIKKNCVFFTIIIFGFFQFYFAFIGGYLGNLFNRYVFKLPSLVGGSIILLVGILMFKEGFNNKDKFNSLHYVLILILGVSVSIDALVIGFSIFNVFTSKLILFKNCIIVGFTTSIFTTISFFISKHIKKLKIIRDYADFLGGIILIFFGIKMIFF